MYIKNHDIILILILSLKNHKKSNNNSKKSNNIQKQQITYKSIKNQCSDERRECNFPFR